MVNAQSQELNLLRARFARYETALRGSHVTVYTQDSELTVHIDFKSDVWARD